MVQAGECVTPARRCAGTGRCNRADALSPGHGRLSEDCCRRCISSGARPPEERVWTLSPLSRLDRALQLSNCFGFRSFHGSPTDRHELLSKKPLVPNWFIMSLPLPRAMNRCRSPPPTRQNRNEDRKNPLTPGGSPTAKDLNRYPHTCIGYRGGQATSRESRVRGTPPRALYTG